MEYQKITKLLGTTPNEMRRFITKKWVEVHDWSVVANGRYKLNKPISVKGDIIFTKAAIRDVIDLRNRFLAFQKNAPFTNCISKFNNVLQKT